MTELKVCKICFDNNLINNAEFRKRDVCKKCETKKIKKKIKFVNIANIQNISLNNNIPRPSQQDY